jgi:hypothetical protein
MRSLLFRPGLCDLKIVFTAELAESAEKKEKYTLRPLRLEHSGR